MWSLSDDVHHLNHGSFGAVPVEVQRAQAETRRIWEDNPTRFVIRDLAPAVARARLALSAFIGSDPAGLAFTRNASQGVAAVVRSLEGTLRPGDEIVTTSHHYNAVRQTLEYSAARTGARVLAVEVPFPVDGPRTVADAVLGAVGPRCRLVVVDHITSPTALVFPVEMIVEALEPDVPVLIDGAHGPGQLPLDLSSLGASWYAGNLHKWVCAPKGSAFLQTREDRREMTVPTVVSHAWNNPLPGSSRYLGLFDWTGTDDMTPWIAVPEALAVVGDLEAGGWPAVMKRNHELALAARDILCQSLGVSKPAPDDMIGSMAGIPLPDHPGPDPGGIDSPLAGRLLDRGYETVVSIWPRWPSQVLRVSAHHYNRVEEYRELAGDLSELVG